MNKLPPAWVLRFFRWYCREDLVDAIEGDLLELHQRRLGKYGPVRSHLLFLWNVLTMCQPFAFKKRPYGRQNSILMWKNHFKIALRLINRQKAFAFSNVLGLSVGVCTSLFLLLYVAHELSFDNFHKDADDIYRVNVISFNPEGNFYRTSAPSPLAALMDTDFPEVVATTRINRPRFPDHLMKAADKEFYEPLVYMSDEGFFDVFSFPLLYGNAKTALDDPNEVIITAAVARKYFGKTDALGEVFTYENQFQLKVTGVLEDPPTNSSLQFSFIIANKTPGLLYPGWLNDWGSSNASVYVKLLTGAQASTTTAKFPEVVERFIKDDLDKGERYVMSLQPLTKVRLNPHVAPERVNESSNKKYTYILPVVGLFILLIAGFNYVNLSTARISGRLKEVGVRKVMGSSASNLRSQFLVESLTLVLLAMFTSVILMVLLLPGFNQLADKSFTLSDLGSPLFVISALSVTILLGLAAGLYPALVLSKAKTLAALNKGFYLPGGGKIYFRNILLTVQFAVTLVMIIATVVIKDQMSFLKEKPLGFDAEQVLYFGQRDRAFWQESGALKNELLKNPQIKSVSYSSGIPGNPGYGSTAKLENGAREFEITHVMVDERFMELYGFELVDGRSFDYDLEADKTGGYLLNETAVRQIGWNNPLGQSLEVWGKKGKVIGVVKDFHFESMKSEIGPIAFHISSSNYRLVSIKLGTDDMAPTIDFLEDQWSQLMPERPFQFDFLDKRFEQYYEDEKRFSSIMNIATVLGLVLAVSGLFSLMAFLINKKAKEISIRKVLGATYLNVTRLFLNRLMGLGLIASVLAMPLAYVFVQQWLGGFAYRTSVSALSFLVAVIIVFSLVVLTVGAQIARSVAKNPVDRLRHE
ncbi:MAG: FtsX-like permease family protein [Roseivirga sp.]|nr:FtsX-like permease family protein [Roseivirga sp.]